MAEIESPCNTICILKGSTCIGCKRTIQEIVNWLSMSDSEKQVVLERLKK